MVKESLDNNQAVLPLFTDTSYKSHWKENLPNEDYHSIKTHMGSSGIKELLKSPSHFYYANSHNSNQQSDAFRIGSLVHAAILEPERFEKNMVIMPKFDKRTKIGKQDHAEFLENRGPEEILVAQAEYETILNIIERVYQHPVARGVLMGGNREWSGFFREPRSGLQGKIRPDMMIREEGMILDLKTTTDSSKIAFERQIAKYRYDVQAAWYLNGARAIDSSVRWEQYFFLAVEKTPPYVTSLYMLDGAALECGEVGVRKALSAYQSSIKTGKWPGYSEVAEFCSVPPYFFKEIEDDLDQQTMEDEHGRG